MKQMNYLSMTALLFITSGAIAEEAVSRDPFSPFLSGNTESVSNAVIDGVQAEPLKKYPAEKYILSAVMSSKKFSIALFETPEGDSFLMIEGDQLGADNFQIDRIERLRVELKNEEDDLLIKRVSKKGVTSDEG